jgi:hypothetical protein
MVCSIFCLTSTADEFVGITHRSTSRYALVYRSIDHRTLRDICTEAKKQNSAAKYMTYLPAGGFWTKHSGVCYRRS